MSYPGSRRWACRGWSGWWPWAVGGLLAGAVLGPALGPGNLFLLDADFVPRYPVPSGIWGLGPSIPRRVPLGALLAWASVPLGGALAGKLLLGGAVVVAFVGASRMLLKQTWPGRVAAGSLYALSPFLLTRLAAGQWNVLAACAVLPWALGTLLTPGERPAGTFLWALAMAATGSAGGVFAGLAVGVGLASERDRAALQGAGLALVAQAPWLVPGLVVSLSGGLSLTGSEAFVTQAHGVAGILGLFSGFGFWRTTSQVGGRAGIGAALLGAALLGLAFFGARSLPRAWRGRAVALACVGLVLTMASALAWTRGAYQSFTSTLVGAPLRDGQRNMALVLVWLAPAAASGAQRLAGKRRSGAQVAMKATPSLVAMALAAPGLWGVGGRLDPVRIPSSWSAARLAVQRDPGPVLALPFDYHLPLALAGGSEVLNPLPDFLGGDVISSSNLNAGAPDVEATDPRVAGLSRLMSDARGAEPVAGGLAKAGVRWVALLHSANWRAYSSLADDPGLTQVVRGGGIQLFEVRAWVGPVRSASGNAVPMRAVVAPLQLMAPSGPAIWDAPGAWGWMRGTRAAGVTVQGLVSLPAGGRVVWYWPAAVVLGSDLAVLAGAVVAWRSRSRAGREDPDPGSLVAAPTGAALQS